MELQIRKMELTLRVPVDVYCYTGIDAMTLPKTLENEMNESQYRDGRYPMKQEMIADGIADMMKEAMAAAVRDFFMRKCGNERVEEGTSSTAKWMVETGRALKEDPPGAHVCWDAKHITINKLEG